MQACHHILKRQWLVNVAECEKGLHSAVGVEIRDAIEETIDWYVWDMICSSVYFEITDHLPKIRKLYE